MYITSFERERSRLKQNADKSAAEMTDDILCVEKLVHGILYHEKDNEYGHPETVCMHKSVVRNEEKMNLNVLESLITDLYFELKGNSLLLVHSNN